jgi:hypothetical protein
VRQETTGVVIRGEGGGIEVSSEFAGAGKQREIRITCGVETFEGIQIDSAAALQ